MKTKIEFETVEYSNRCTLQDDLKQCCCQCIFHLRVTKACTYFPKNGHCVCDESLGFYVCSFFSQESYSAQFIGEHSIGCENYTRRTNV